MPTRVNNSGPVAGTQVIYHPPGSTSKPGLTPAQKIGNFFRGPKMPGIPGAPTAEQLYNGPQAFSGYGGAAAATQTNPAATQALQQLQGIAASGWSASDRQAQAQSAAQAAAQEQGQRGAVEQQAAARGQYGGGMQMMGALAAQQGGANRAADSAAGIAAQGADRRFQATQAAGQMGMGLTGLDMQRGSAADEMNKWATGRQADAVMGSHGAQMGVYGAQMQQYEAKAANQDKWLDRIMGLVGAGS